MKKYICLLLLTIVSFGASAQDAEMADVMRSNGKIYVVLGIVLIVLVGLITYLFLLDRKITRVERQLNSKK